MAIEYCKEVTPEQEVFIVQQFAEGFGSARITTRFKIRYNKHIRYSFVIRILNKNGLRRSKEEARKIMPPCNLKTTLNLLK